MLIFLDTMEMIDSMVTMDNAIIITVDITMDIHMKVTAH